MDEYKDMTLREKLDMIIKRQDELFKAKEIKKFRLPSKAKINRGKIRKNWVTVQYITENGQTDFFKAQIVDGTITIDGIPRIATADFIMDYKGKPMILIPAWSLRPYSPVESYEKCVEDKLTTTGRKLVIAKMKHDAIAPKKANMGMIVWVILGIAIIAGGYYLFKGGKLF